MKSRSWPLMSSTGPCSFFSASVVGKVEGGAPALAACTPELNTPIVPTRGSAPSVIDRNPPHDWPMTATRLVSILPFSGEPARAFSRSAQSMAALRSSAVAWRRGVPSCCTPAVVMTRKPCEAIVVRKPA